MTKRFLAVVTGAMLVLTASEGAAQAGIGTPLVQSPTRGASRVGTRGANFLEIGLGARALGMAGAYSAIAEGLSGLYWNLAGTAEVQNVAGGVNYSKLYGSDGLSFIWGGALMPIGGGVLGIQVGQMSSGKIPRTSYDFPDGGDPTVGPTFEFTGTTAALSYARRLTDRLNVGAGFKYATEGITNASINYFGADVGIKFRTGLYGTTLGASLANLGSSGKYSGNLVEANTFNTFVPGLVRVQYDMKEYEMPTIFRFSVLADLIGGPEALLSNRTGLGSLRLVGEMVNAIDTDLQPAIGAEYGWRNMLFLRAGRRWYNEAWERGKSNAPFIERSDYWNRGLAFGGGLRLPLAGRHIAFDYAWQGSGELPANNHFSFEFGF
jgi:hypothetical protein